MKEWLEDFYGSPEMRRTLMEAFLPAFNNYVTEAVGNVTSDFVVALAEGYVDRYLGSSRAQLQEVVGASDNPLADLAARFDEWEEKRPTKVAKNELIRSANAAQVQQMRSSGVEKMVWRASGGACPFCQELDGVIISVNGTFFEPGDELSPEGVESPIHFESTIGHPPVHQGCSCFVEAVTETEVAGEDGMVRAEPMSEEQFNEIVGAVPYGGNGDGRLTALSKQNGFEGRPQVVSKAEIDAFVANGEREWFRGLEGQGFADQFREGDIYYGFGYHGNGIYAATGDRGVIFSSRTRTEIPGLSAEEAARNFTGRGGEVMRGTIRADAKIIDRREAETMWMDAGGFSAGYDGPTEWAMAQGYDAVMVTGQSRTAVFGELGGEEFGDQLIILNRTAVRVQDENV